MSTLFSIFGAIWTFTLLHVDALARFPYGATANLTPDMKIYDAETHMRDSYIECMLPV